MRQVVQSEYGMFFPLVDAQHGQTGRQNVHRKIQAVHVLYVHAQPIEDDILYRPLMGYDNQVFLFLVSHFMYSIDGTPEKFSPGFPAGIIPVIQFL